MSKKQTNNILTVAAIAGVGYLIFKRLTPAAGTVAVARPAPTTASNLISQATNVFTSLFGGLPTPDQNIAAASNPDLIAPVSTTPAPVTAIDAPPPPSSGMPLQFLNGVNIKSLPPGTYNTTGGATSPFISIDAAPLDAESIAGAHDWSGKYKGVFSGKNSGMNPFTEINGTGLAALGACLACALPSRAIGKIAWEKYIIPVGVVVGGYVLLKNTNLFGGVKTGITANNDASAAATNDALTKSIAAAAASGDIQTITTAQAATLANDIAVKGLLSAPDQDGIQRDIIQANTLTDLLQIMKAFGTREANTGSWYSVCAFTGLNCTSLDMATFVRMTLDQSHLAAVNQYLTAQQINFQF